MFCAKGLYETLVVMVIVAAHLCVKTAVINGLFEALSAGVHEGIYFPLLTTLLFADEKKRHLHICLNSDKS